MVRDDDTGFYGVDPRDSRAIKRHFAGKRGVNLDRARRIACAGFPELERGEQVSGIEIKRRIGQIRAAGYEVKPGYWSLDSDTAWRYLMQIRKELHESSS